MKFGWEIHLVSDTNCNTVNLLSPSPQKSYKEWQMMLGLQLVLVSVNLYRGLQLDVEQDN